MTGRRLEADLGGIRRTREWGFSADDMAAVQQQHHRQARRCRWTVTVLSVVAAVLAVLAIAGEWS